jgi:hypothetical protein
MKPGCRSACIRSAWAASGTRRSLSLGLQLLLVKPDALALGLRLGRVQSALVIPLLLFLLAAVALPLGCRSRSAGSLRLVSIDAVDLALIETVASEVALLLADGIGRGWRPLCAHRRWLGRCGKTPGTSACGQEPGKGRAVPDRLHAAPDNRPGSERGCCQREVPGTIDGLHRVACLACRLELLSGTMGGRQAGHLQQELLPRRYRLRLCPQRLRNGGIRPRGRNPASLQIPADIERRPAGAP